MEHHIKAVWSDNEDGTVCLRTEVAGESVTVDLSGWPTDKEGADDAR